MVPAGTRFSSWLMVVVGLTVLASLCFTRVDGGMMFSRGPCPEGVKKGGTWIPKDWGFCMECSCFGPHQGFQCYGCGLVSIRLNSPECYVADVSPEANYPECCHKEQRCPGDEGYDPSKASGSGSSL